MPAPSDPRRIQNILVVVVLSIFLLTMYVYGKINMFKEISFYKKEDFGYLPTPSYRAYQNLVDDNLKSPPYYEFNREQLNIPIFYNFLLPAIPAISLRGCPENSTLQYWFTPQ